MLQSLGFKDAYYDLEKKIIARCPTQSNLKEGGTDNSLYCGQTTTINQVDVFKNIFDVVDLQSIVGKQIQMNFNNKYNITVEFNINAYNQLQLKISKDGRKDGVIRKMYIDDGKEENMYDYLLSFDFINKTLSIKETKELDELYEIKELFKNWLEGKLVDPNCKMNSEKSMEDYINSLDKLFDYNGSSQSIYKLSKSEIKELYEIEKKKYSKEGKTGKNQDSAAIGKYLEFLNECKPYKKEDFKNEVFLDDDKYEELATLLLYKKNIILKGAPGVGKTFLAKRLAFSLLGGTLINYVEMVQFHQSYGYEDFIMGYKPTKDGGFELTPGIFYNFCQKAKNDQNKNHKYFFIIDEINRGNLSKIFGELMMLIENDKRGNNYSVKLAYKDEQFSVPENVYIIGTMNTADRSLTKLDYALRRRFSFYDVPPAFDSDGFKRIKNNIKNEKFNALVDAIKEINEIISKDESLGIGYQIGHSYLCGLENEFSEDKLKSVAQYDIIPILEEYWFDNEEELEQTKKIIKNVIKEW